MWQPSAGLVGRGKVAEGGRRPGHSCFIEGKKKPIMSGTNSQKENIKKTHKRRKCQFHFNGRQLPFIFYLKTFKYKCKDGAIEYKKERLG